MPSDPIFIGDPKDQTPVFANRLEVSVPSGTAAGTPFYLATLPTSLIMHASPVFWTALGASVALDFALRARNKLADPTTALVSDLDASVDVSVALNLSDKPADIGRPIWAVLGETGDIRTDVDLIVTTKGATTATAGQIVVNLLYAY